MAGSSYRRWGAKDYGWYVGIPGVLVVEVWARADDPPVVPWGVLVTARVA